MLPALQATCDRSLFTWQNRQRNYRVHTLWMIALFLQLMLCWWVFYRWKGAPQWNFYLFLWVTIAPTLLYLASGVLCPGELDSTGDNDATRAEQLLQEGLQAAGLDLSSLQRIPGRNRGK